MTLTTRLSLFFLAALALVLLGFSAAIYFLAHTYLHRQADERLQTALNTLATAAESEPGGLEWEGQDRHFALDTGASPVAWIVTDERGNWVDGCQRSFPDKNTGHSLTLATAAESSQVISWRAQAWHVAQRRLRATAGAAAPVQQRKAQDPPLFVALQITAGVSLEPIHAALRNLAIALSGASAGTWLLALLGGGWLCRRALRPLTEMAAAARAMDADALEQRLPATNSGDEVADLGLAFNDLLTRVQESFERQRRFTGDASHQLRTPLTAILGQIEVALRRPRSPEDYQKVLTLVDRKAQHLRQIVEMLLFLARADGDAKLPHLETIQLNDWLTEHLHSWSDHERFADLRIEDKANGPLPVRAQPALLGQLVDNLLDNACKYSQLGAPITLRLGGENGSALLAVEDCGSGICPDDMPLIFEPFYRSAHAREKGLNGVGLGLAIAQHIARASRGCISVTSQPSKGSCFTLSLPLQRGSP